MLLAAFDPPGFVNDLTAAQKKKWSKFISDRIDSEIAGAAGHHFYNPTKKDTAADVQTAEISWTAFPLLRYTRLPIRLVGDRPMARAMFRMNTVNGA
jgi:hypothetical protein